MKRSHTPLHYDRPEKQRDRTRAVNHLQVAKATEMLKHTRIGGRCHELGRTWRRSTGERRGTRLIRLVPVVAAIHCIELALGRRLSRSGGRRRGHP